MQLKLCQTVSEDLTQTACPNSRVGLKDLQVCCSQHLPLQQQNSDPCTVRMDNHEGFILHWQAGLQAMWVNVPSMFRCGLKCT